jgi:hypothetical protein
MPADLKPFGVARPVIGMIHVGALPGTPAGGGGLRELEARAVREARVYRDAGLHGCMLENMHDTPYLRGGVGPEIVAAMAVIARAVKDAVRLPCGVQILAAANREALAVALAAGLDFIRAEGFSFAHVADEGLIQSGAAELLRYRRAISAEHVQIWADIKKKHSSHAITADVGIGETAHRHGRPAPARGRPRREACDGAAGRPGLGDHRGQPRGIHWRGRRLHRGLGIQGGRPLGRCPGRQASEALYGAVLVARSLARQLGAIASGILSRIPWKLPGWRHFCSRIPAPQFFPPTPLSP